MIGKALVFLLCNLFVLSSCSFSFRLLDRNVFVNTDRLNWFQAFETCRSRGQRLLAVKTSEENSIVHELCKANQVQYPWLDGSDLGAQDQWFWMYSGLEITSFFWLLKPPEPDNSGGIEHCLHIDTNLGSPLNNWNDYPCVASTPYICEELPYNDGGIKLNPIFADFMFQVNMTGVKYSAPGQEDYIDSWKIEFNQTVSN